MQVLNLEEKNTERMEAINKFTLMDDTFMTQVFSGDLECTEELLKIILKRNDFCDKIGYTVDNRKSVRTICKT